MIMILTIMATAADCARLDGFQGASGVPARLLVAALITVSAKSKLLLRQPLPCNPAAETALQPLIWCFES